MTSLNFGPFTLDLGAGRLLRDQFAVELRPQALEVLAALARNTGKFVGYDAMLREAWRGTTVSKHTVAVTIAEVKKALGECGSWITYRHNLGYRLEIPGNHDLVRKGWHLANQQTLEGLEKAQRCFEEAALHDSTDIMAFEGLRQSFLMLGTYGMRPPEEVNRGFWRAFDRSLELTGLTGELLSDRGHARMTDQRRFSESEKDLREALRLVPGLPHTYIRLSMLCAVTGRLDEAIEIERQSHSADALLPTAPAAEIFVRLCRGEVDLAIDCAEAGIELHPFVPLARVLYAEALEQAGRHEEAIDHISTACALSPDLPWLHALEGAYLARYDRLRAAAIYDELQHCRGHIYVDAYFMSIFEDAMGRPAAAIRELERAVAENSWTLFLLDADPRMERVRRHPDYARIREAVFPEANLQAARA